MIDCCKLGGCWWEGAECSNWVEFDICPFLVYLLVDLCSWLVVLAGTCSAVNEIKWTGPFFLTGLKYFRYS